MFMCYLRFSIFSIKYIYWKNLIRKFLEKIRKFKKLSANLKSCPRIYKFTANLKISVVPDSLVLFPQFGISAVNLQIRDRFSKFPLEDFQIEQKSWVRVNRLIPTNKPPSTHWTGVLNSVMSRFEGIEKSIFAKIQHF